MKKLLTLAGLMLIVAGCGTVIPAEDTVSDTVDINTDSQVVVMATEYQFVFPGTGWYMDFEYADGFAVEEQEGSVVFKLFDGDIIFDYDNSAVVFTDGEKYSGHGWWGQQKSGQIAFTTPDEKFHVLVSGEDDLLKEFVEGMTMGK